MSAGKLQGIKHGQYEVDVITKEVHSHDFGMNSSCLTGELHNHSFCKFDVGNIT